MAWSPAGTIQLSKDWQYTEPIEGEYFRLKHSEARYGDLFTIAQCEVDADGNLSIGDSQILAVEKGVNDVLKLPKATFTDRRIAVKRISSQPNLEQEIRRLFLPNLLTDVQEEIRFIRRNNWSIVIEVSDYKEVKGIDYSDFFADITTKLATIEQKIDSIDTSGSGETPTRSTTKTLTYVSDGDNNGVCYWIGTDYGAKAWTNPHAANRVTISKSGDAEPQFNFVERLVDRAENSVGTNSAINSWIKIDLGNTNKLAIDYYSLRGRADQYNDNHLQTWKLQGSNDDTAWTDIDNQTNNPVTPSNWKSIAVANQTASYRYLRILITGVTSNNAYFLVLGEFEFYGTLTRT